MLDGIKRKNAFAERQAAIIGGENKNFQHPRTPYHQSASKVKHEGSYPDDEDSSNLVPQSQQQIIEGPMTSSNNYNDTMTQKISK